MTHPGTWAGEILRSNDHQNTSQLAGRRVLVVGNGNTGCDIAVAAAAVNGTADISMRAGAYIFPKVFLGVPTAELGRRLPFKGAWVDRSIARIIHRCAMGNEARYGMPMPRFRILDKHPVVNDELPALIRQGRITPRPDIARLNRTLVHFLDGTTAQYDLIVYAVGYRISLPMLHPDDALLNWADNVPIVHSQLIAPTVRGLFLSGLGQARTGGGFLFQEAG